MKIYLARHGQTNLNKKRLMQGLTDEPLNEVGISQAMHMHDLLKDVSFDAVYSSPLDRAIETASIISGKDRKDIIIDPRIIEVNFGKYELKNYYLMGPRMSAFWALPEIISAPSTVETIDSLVKRSSSFLKDVENSGYQNVLIVCHGGIIRALRGYLNDSKNGITWRPRPKNCEILVYESNNGEHKFIKQIIG